MQIAFSKSEKLIGHTIKSSYNWQQKQTDQANTLARVTISAQDSNTQEIEQSTSTTLRNLRENGIENEQKLKRANLFLYLSLAAFTTVTVLLILLFLKRSSRLKHMRSLEERNKKTQIKSKSLIKRNRHLVETNQIKDKLFSIVSHDLKDSLTSIKGFIDLLKDGSLSKKEFNHLIPELSENADSASLLLFNLLNWSKSQMNSLESNPSLFDIQDVFAEKINLIGRKTKKKGIQIKDKSSSDFVFADKSMVEIIIQNLLTNAIKFCKEGDSIIITNSNNNDHALISITDTGIGISKENQDKLFKNRSFSTMGTKNEKGTGLGLNICKELTELNRGKIWLESTENMGSTFFIKFPKSNVGIN